ncbi:MAG TPA: multidrug ABC transporter ATP-binding protein, partial [Butyricimonas virosa]|nr:multidrug ABC transporter ATP-binding protein [Butyricimonas virosa]
QDILEQVVRESVLQEWHLREITLERESLDSVFAQLSNKKLN